jgi:hypothetical protein
LLDWQLEIAAAQGEAEDAFFALPEDQNPPAFGQGLVGESCSRDREIDRFLTLAFLKKF